ncbi:MAG: EpsG family protein [Oscillospiraceae bacterium]|nr:EpsG family protein [Oscillospiraceae bacterium]
MNGFYWIYLVMIGFLLGYYRAKREDTRRLILYGACGFLILIFVLQDYSVSIDIAEYMRQWDIIPGLTFPEMLVHKFEIGYVLLCYVLERTFASDRVLLLVLGVLILVPFCRSFEEETEDPMIALMAFVALGMYMHAMIFWRQLAAMAILILSLRYIKERKLLPFLALVLMAMTFHKVSVVFIPLYFVYNIPINKWLLLFCGAASVILSFFGKPIIEFGIRYIYPRYLEYPRLTEGGYTLLALLWSVTLLSYWLLRDKMDDPRVRIPFLMTLTAAMIQPICFTFFWWLRVVLFFRVALVYLTAHLYRAVFLERSNNRLLALLQRYTPGLHRFVLKLYARPWFLTAARLALFAVLFVWYASELDGAVYVMAPIV